MAFRSWWLVTASAVRQWGSGRALLEWGGFGGVGGQAQRLLAGEAALRGPVELA